MRCRQGFRNVSLSNVLSFFERCSHITTTVYAHKLNNARSLYLQFLNLYKNAFFFQSTASVKLLTLIFSKDSKIAMSHWSKNNYAHGFIWYVYTI